MITVREQRPFWAAFLVLGTLTAAAFVALRTLGMGAHLAGVLYAGLSTATALAVPAAVWRYRPDGRTGWLLLGAGQLVPPGEVAFPGAADALHLAQYPLVAAALVSFVRRRTPGRHIPSLLDAGILAIAAGLLSWVYLTPADRLVTVAYPVGDLLVLAIGLRMLLGGGARTPSCLMLLGSLVAMLAGDAAFTILGGAANGWDGFLWLLAYALLGGSALHPSMRRIDDPAPVRAVPSTPARVVALAAASLLAPVVLLVQYTRGTTRDVPVIAVACALLFLLVLGRMAGLVAEQHRLAVTDVLTGLHTRRAFEERLRAVRRGRPLGLILVDIDHFKRVNDSFGHPAGDRVLREVADRLRAAAGPGVTLARYGGEEFALLVPDADAERTAQVADRLRAAVGGGPIELGTGVHRAVSVSAGTAVLPADAADPGELVHLADRALYAAKRAGRDRVVTAGQCAKVTRVPAEPEDWPTPLPRPRRTELEAA
ncbi:GGDEF domain-containing protein [Dactylosporangium salmoneum]|uniref:GGDEF domain-containing protein n=1 Tax=Dactylosporangium salmoneum TaxID=53361 RepID=UPI0031D925C9